MTEDTVKQLNGFLKKKKVSRLLSDLTHPFSACCASHCLIANRKPEPPSMETFVPVANIRGRCGITSSYQPHNAVED